MRRVTLGEINSTLGVTLDAELISKTLNVQQCDERGMQSDDSGMWSAADFWTIKARLANYLLYGAPDKIAEPFSFDFSLDNFFN